MRLHFYVGKQLAERVEHVGVMLGHAKARAAAFLLDNASQVESDAMGALERRLESTTGAARATSGPSDEIVLMYVRLDPAVAARIERLAKKKSLSVSKVCAWLLSQAADDDKWIVQIVQVRLSEALAKPAKGRQGRVRRKLEPQPGL